MLTRETSHKRIHAVLPRAAIAKRSAERRDESPLERSNCSSAAACREIIMIYFAITPPPDAHTETVYNRNARDERRKTDSWRAQTRVSGGGPCTAACASVRVGGAAGSDATGWACALRSGGTAGRR